MEQWWPPESIEPAKAMAERNDLQPTLIPRGWLLSMLERHAQAVLLGQLSWHSLSPGAC